MRKVLIIAEGFDDCRIVKAALMRHFQVLLVATVEEALQIIPIKCPDIVMWGPKLSVEQEAQISWAMELRPPTPP